MLFTLIGIILIAFFFFILIFSDGKVNNPSEFIVQTPKGFFNDRRIKMSAWLDQIKFNMSNQLSKVYKDAKANANPEEWSEFESWFWKIKPLILVDFSKYEPGGNSETTGPNFVVRSDLQKV